MRILELQVARIYAATGLEKMSGTLWPQGPAAYYSLHLEHTFGRAWARPIAQIPATLTNGTTLDLLTGGPVDDSSERYSDPLYSCWTKVFERIASAAYTDYRLEYARHICRTHNLHLGPGDVPIATFDVDYVERVIAAPGEGPPTFRDIQLWTHRC